MARHGQSGIAARLSWLSQSARLKLQSIPRLQRRLEPPPKTQAVFKRARPVKASCDGQLRAGSTRRAQAPHIPPHHSVNLGTCSGLCGCSLPDGRYPPCVRGYLRRARVTSQSAYIVTDPRPVTVVLCERRHLLSLRGARGLACSYRLMATETWRSGPLRRGVRAVLSGLQCRHELNGAEVMLLFFEGERWGVECKSGERIKVKPQNLAPLEGAACDIDRQVRHFERRLRFIGAEQNCRFSARNLLDAVKPELPSECDVMDCSDQLNNVTGQPSILVAITFLTTTAADVPAGRLIYVQRTARNAQTLLLTFAVAKHGAQIDESEVDEPIELPAPGWLAWCRDDYFFGSAELDLPLARRMLVNFARGTSECPFCLEPIMSHGPSTSLSCGHMMHNECLLNALRHASCCRACPVCRAPIEDGFFRLECKAEAAVDQRVGNRRGMATVGSAEAMGAGDELEQLQRRDGAPEDSFATPVIPTEAHMLHVIQARSRDDSGDYYCGVCVPACTVQ